MTNDQKYIFLLNHFKAFDVENSCSPKQKMFGSEANVANDAENFFQSDRDLHLMAARKYKMQELGERGKPISLVSKILHFELEGNSAYVAQSGFITQKIELPVNFSVNRSLA